MRRNGLRMGKLNMADGSSDSSLTRVLSVQAQSQALDVRLKLCATVSSLASLFLGSQRGKRPDIQSQASVAHDGKWQKTLLWRGYQKGP